MGELNSSLNRVQPIFNALFSTDRSGASWLQPLLMMAKRDGYPKPLRITADLGGLVQKPQFEFPVDPPKSYLRWLIETPGKLKRPPRAMLEKWSEHTRKMRQDLFAGHREVQIKAISDLEKCSTLPKSSWWRFECK